MPSSFVSNRMMQVAAELEEYYESTRQRTERAHADALARISQLEVQAMQHQLQSLRLEAQLHDTNTLRAQLEHQIQGLQDDNARLRDAVINGEDSGGGTNKEHLDRINVSTRRRRSRAPAFAHTRTRRRPSLAPSQPSRDTIHHALCAAAPGRAMNPCARAPAAIRRSQELSRELIATRFQLAHVSASGDGAHGAAASPQRSPPSDFDAASPNAASLGPSSTRRRRD
eukprot:1582173-Prymnesium_polylepis.1